MSRAPTKLHSAGSCGSQAGVHALGDDLAVRLFERQPPGRQAAKFRPDRVAAVAGVEALSGCDQCHVMALQFIQYERQVGQTPSQTVELEYNDALDLAGAHRGHERVQTWADMLRSRNLVGANLEIGPATSSTVGT